MEIINLDAHDSPEKCWCCGADFNEGDEIVSSTNIFTNMSDFAHKECTEDFELMNKRALELLEIGFKCWNCLDPINRRYPLAHKLKVRYSIYGICKECRDLGVEPLQQCSNYHCQNKGVLVYLSENTFKCLYCMTRSD